MIIMHISIINYSGCKTFVLSHFLVYHLEIEWRDERHETNLKFYQRLNSNIEVNIIERCKCIKISTQKRKQIISSLSYIYSYVLTIYPKLCLCKAFFGSSKIIEKLASSVYHVWNKPNAFFTNHNSINAHGDYIFLVTTIHDCCWCSHNRKENGFSR